jgi:hypothetical protein
MPATYEPIATNTVSGGSTASITFSSIPSTYTDLVLIFNGSMTGGSNGALRFNGDTATNYSVTGIYGSGTVGGSFRSSNVGVLITNFAGTTGDQNVTRMMLMNYSNTTTNKCLLYRNDNTLNAAVAGVGLWRSTAAINSITFVQTVGASYFTAGSTLTLYGIKAA